MPEAAVLLGIITLGAAIVNGGLGYGFSSLTVPLALLFMTNRVLNPALVLLEVPLNGYVLFVNRHSITEVWRRVLPVVIALGPGTVIGTSVVGSVSPAWVKVGTYVVLLPLILAQAAGYRRPVQAQRIAGLVFGGCLGVLYSVTTISGPPLAIALSNQGLAKQEFPRGTGRHSASGVIVDGRRLSLCWDDHTRQCCTGWETCFRVSSSACHWGLRWSAEFTPKRSVGSA